MALAAGTLRVTSLSTASAHMAIAGPTVKHVSDNVTQFEPLQHTPSLKSYIAVLVHLIGVGVFI